MGGRDVRPAACQCANVHLQNRAACSISILVALRALHLGAGSVLSVGQPGPSRRDAMRAPRRQDGMRGRTWRAERFARSPGQRQPDYELPAYYSILILSVVWKGHRRATPGWLAPMTPPATFCHYCTCSATYKLCCVWHAIVCGAYSDISILYLSFLCTVGSHRLVPASLVLQALPSATVWRRLPTGTRVARGCYAKWCRRLPTSILCPRCVAGAVHYAPPCPVPPPP